MRKKYKMKWLAEQGFQLKLLTWKAEIKKTVEKKTSKKKTKNEKNCQKIGSLNRNNSTLIDL